MDMRSETQSSPLAPTDHVLRTIIANSYDLIAVVALDA